MRAVSLEGPGKLRIVDIPEPRIGDEDVLLEVRYVGLCGSDLKAYRGEMPFVTYPRIPGHEVSGVIISKGGKVPPSIQVGESVAVWPYTNCGKCPACRRGQYNACQFNQTLGVQRDGALSELFSIHYTNVFVNKVLSREELALIEPLSVGHHAVSRGRVSESDMVLVIGCGMVGMGAIIAAVRRNATVIACDIDDDKLMFAIKFGAKHVINSAKQDPLKEILRLTSGEGVSVAIEAVGSPQTFRLAVGATSYAGRVVYVGYTKEEACYDTSEFVRKELSIYGSRNALRDDFKAVMDMLEKKEWPFEALVGHIYPLVQTPQAFKEWDENPGKFIKVLIKVK